MGASQRKTTKKETQKQEFEFVSEEMIAESGVYSCEFGYWKRNGTRMGSASMMYFLQKDEDGNKKSIHKFDVEHADDYGNVFAAAADWMRS